MPSAMAGSQGSWEKAVESDGATDSSTVCLASSVPRRMAPAVRSRTSSTSTRANRMVPASTGAGLWRDGV